MDLTFIAATLPHLLRAAGTTALVSALATLLALLAGAGLAAARMAPGRVLRGLAAAAISLLRGTPCLLQLLILYTGSAQLGWPLPPLAAGVLGLGLNGAAPAAEAMRGGVGGVAAGQREAARALGLSRWQALRLVLLPQAAVLMIRPLGAVAAGILKTSSLVAVVSLADLTATAQRLGSSSFRPAEMILMAGLLYLGLGHVITAITARIERRALRQRQG